MASRIASLIWSAILSGWPSVTDSEVKRRRDKSVAPHAAAAGVWGLWRRQDTSSASPKSSPTWSGVAKPSRIRLSRVGPPRREAAAGQSGLHLELSYQIEHVLIREKAPESTS